jgi:hypothetical protein
MDNNNGLHQKYILDRIEKKGFFLSRGRRDNLSIDNLLKKKLIKTGIHITKSGLRIRKAYK